MGSKELFCLKSLLILKFKTEWARLAWIKLLGMIGENSRVRNSQEIELNQ